jgi:hypothetical protein
VKIFTPLSQLGLWDAVRTIPTFAAVCTVASAMAEVGNTPQSNTLIFSENPRTNAWKSGIPLHRVSVPTHMPMESFPHLSEKNFPMAFASLRKNSSQIGCLPNFPRMPSVPKYLIAKMFGAF